MKTSYLIPRLLGCSILVGELVTRHRWWISHPQAFSKQGKSTSLNYQSISPSLVDFAVFGGMGREPKKTPPLRLPDLALFCGYPIHPTLSKVRGFLMLYSYLIAPKGTILSKLSSPRIIRFNYSCTKNGKTALNSIPAAWVSRISTGRAI